MLNLIITLLIGLFAGIIAKAVMPGGSKEPSGWILTIVLGIAGAFVGNWVGGLFGLGAYGFIGQTLMAAVGAIIIIALLRLFTNRRVA